MLPQASDICSKCNAPTDNYTIYCIDCQKAYHSDCINFFSTQIADGTFSCCISTRSINEHSNNFNQVAISKENERSLNTADRNCTANPVGLVSSAKTVLNLNVNSSMCTNFKCDFPSCDFSVNVPKFECIYCNTLYHYKCAVQTECVITSVNGSESIRSLVCSPCDIINKPLNNVENASSNEVSNNVILQELKDMRNSMDSRLPKLSARIATNSNDIISLKSDVNSIRNELKNRPTHLDSSNIDSIIDRLASETADRARGNRNILLRNISESNSNSLDEKWRHDLYRTLDALSPICSYEDNQILISRVSTKIIPGYPRPICVTLPSYDDALHAVRNKSKVRNGYIASDLTPLQQKQRQELLDEIESLKAQGIYKRIKYANNHMTFVDDDNMVHSSTPASTLGQPDDLMCLDDELYSQQEIVPALDHRTNVINNKSQTNKFVSDVVVNKKAGNAISNLSTNTNNTVQRKPKAKRGRGRPRLNRSSDDRIEMGDLDLSQNDLLSQPLADSGSDTTTGSRKRKVSSTEYSPTAAQPSKRNINGTRIPQTRSFAARGGGFASTNRGGKQIVQNFRVQQPFVAKNFQVTRPQTYR